MMPDSNGERFSRCAFCREERKICSDPGGTGPPWCPTLRLRSLIEEAVAHYREDEETGSLALAASIQEGECYADRGPGPDARPHAVKPRALEIIEFARKMGYERIGVAFCTGLAREAAIFCGMLEDHGLEAVSVSCKAGGVPKETLGVRDDQKIRIGRFESMCSPIVQAAILDHYRTGLNVVIGLCVGHDSLFFRYSRAPVTVLVAKDRVTGHNPAAVLYTAHSYSRNLMAGEGIAEAGEGGSEAVPGDRPPGRGA